uniref:Uncharacterized protein n=1 Tax=Ditylenchus dipsaci TaxID=166011 RepID=A0A915DJT1_9BILA
MELTASLRIFLEVKSAVKKAPGEIGRKVEKKFEYVMRNNPGLERLLAASKQSLAAIHSACEVCLSRWSSLLSISVICNAAFLAARCCGGCWCRLQVGLVKSSGESQGNVVPPSSLSQQSDKPSNDVITASSPSYATSPAIRNLDAPSRDLSTARMHVCQSSDAPSKDVITAKSPVYETPSVGQSSGEQQPSDDVKTAASPTYATSPAKENANGQSSDVSTARAHARHSDEAPSDDVKTADSPSYAPSPAARNVDEPSSDVSTARVHASRSDDCSSDGVITAKPPVLDASSTKKGVDEQQPSDDVKTAGSPSYATSPAKITGDDPTTDVSTARTHVQSAANGPSSDVVTAKSPVYDTSSSSKQLEGQQPSDDVRTASSPKLSDKQVYWQLRCAGKLKKKKKHKKDKKGKSGSKHGKRSKGGSSSSATSTEPSKDGKAKKKKKSKKQSKKGDE